MCHTYSITIDNSNIPTFIRQKRLEEQANSQRTMALQAELKKKLEIAMEFRKRELLIRCGLSPWLRYIAICRNQDDDAMHFHANKLQHRYWQYLKSYYVTMKTERVRREYRLSIMANVHYK
jgi:hypothetical protein